MYTLTSIQTYEIAKTRRSELEAAARRHALLRLRRRTRRQAGCSH